MRNVDGFDIDGIAPVKLDVTDRNSIIAAAVSSADTTVLINNAGIGGIVPVDREGGRYSMEQMTEVKWSPSRWINGNSPSKEHRA